MNGGPACIYVPYITCHILVPPALLEQVPAGDKQDTQLIGNQVNEVAGSRQSIGTNT
jgi:hypothetical protein